MHPNEMSLSLAALLGFVQGITEFLPISSDGHLAIAAWLWGDVEVSLSMVVLLHLGTLIATVIILREDVKKLSIDLWRLVRNPREAMKTPEGRTIVTVLVATIPTGIIGLAIEDEVEPWSRIMPIVATCLLYSAAWVGSVKWAASRAVRDEAWLPVWQALFLGVVQGIAVLPGASRSGSTIALAMWLGLSGTAAFRLSFLLSLPAIFGAVVLKLRHPEVWSELGMPGLVGVTVSFVVGLVSLAGLREIVARGRFWAFAIYLVPLALFLFAAGMR